MDNPMQRIPMGHRSVKRKPKPLDNAVAGLFSGIIFGIVGLILVYFIIYRSRGFDFYLDMFLKMEPTSAYAAKNISLAMICNLIPFYFFLNKKYYQGTKGVIVATVLMGVLFVLYKFVW